MEEHTFKPLCVNDFKKYIDRRLPKAYSEYVNLGADEGLTWKDNSRAWKKLKIRPRYLTGVSVDGIDTSIDFFGHKLKSPVCITPAGLQRLAYEEGAIATLKGCRKHSNCMVLSTAATTSYKDLMEANQGVFLGASIEITKDRKALDLLIERIESLNYKFIVLAIDNPVIGNHLHDQRNNFNVPKSITLPNAMKYYADSLGQTVSEAFEDSQLTQDKYFFLPLDLNKTWDDVRYVTNKTKLPLIIKGVLTGEDALKAIESGASGVTVSNHGGRQLDSVPSTLDVLPEIVAAVGSKVPVFVDGGIRHGSHVFKALALGARAVFIGRPIFWGLAYDGANGVEQVLDILQNELERTMMLAGCKNVSSITKEHIIHKSQLESRLAKNCASKL